MSDYGERIKQIRTEKKISLRQLADESGVSVSQISKIETGKGDTTVKNLMQIARALGVSVPSIIGEDEVKTVRPLRRGEGFAIGRQICSDKRWKEIFLNMDPNAMMQPEVMYIPPSGDSLKPLTHAGEEFVYVLKGKIVCRLADNDYEMSEGDFLYFKSCTPHTYKNADAEEWSEILVCTSPPVFK